MKFHIILENVAGKLDERFCDAAEQLQATVIEMVAEVELRDGDVIRIVQQEEL